MRILIVGINFHPELTGIGKYTGELAYYLSKKGHHVTVITTPPYYPDWQIKAGFSGSHYHTEQLENLKIIRCPLWVPRQVSGLKRILHLFSFVLSSTPVVWREARYKPDVVLSIAPALLATPVAVLTGKRASAHTWLHIQDFELDAALDLGILNNNLLIRTSALNFEKWVFRNFEWISSISEKMLERLTGKGVPAEKIVYFPNWVDTDEIFPLEVANLFRKNLGLSDGDIVVLYSGSMGAKQGLEMVAAAARLLELTPNIHFVLCGEGPAKAGLQSAVSGLTNVHFLQLQPVELLNQLLNLADIHILPQRVDASDLVMPSKLLGMLASGKAVIATANAGTGLADIVNQVGKVVAPGDPSALGQAIVDLAEARKLRLEMGKNGRNYVCKTWSKEIILARFEAQLQKLVQS